MKAKEKNIGFTLIELLVVMAILGILIMVGFANFRSSQKRGRDAKRKSDLEQIQRALEMYHNDYGFYPLSDNGYIQIETTNFNWGEVLKDTHLDSNNQEIGTVYMKELPSDPVANQTYCYLSADGSSYIIYAKLENTQDAMVLNPERTCAESNYNYGVSSSDLVP